MPNYYAVLVEPVRGKKYWALIGTVTYSTTHSPVGDVATTDEFEAIRAAAYFSHHLIDPADNRPIKSARVVPVTITVKEK